MENNVNRNRSTHFQWLKLAKKRRVTKNTVALEFEIPHELRKDFKFHSGQYLSLRYTYNNKVYENDFSIITAPYEHKIGLGIKINSEKSSSNALAMLEEGSLVEVSRPQGRFVLKSKPHEFRTILGFAGGIGITPIFSHLKNILHTEPRTRFFLFYGNKTSANIAFKEELDALAKQYEDRFQVFYFLSQEQTKNRLFHGRITAHKVELIINQILHLDDTDEESTIWDSVDHVLISGKGEMIKSIANACYENGMMKPNIHFELFEAFNEDIYPQEKEFPLVENIDLYFTLKGEEQHVNFKDNRVKVLQELLQQKYKVPYSCKSGICGICECILEEGHVELVENEYLTETELKKGHVLACQAVLMSNKVKLNFDIFENTL